MPDSTVVIQTLAEANNLAVDIEGGNLTEGTNCQLYDRNNSAAQICRFISAGSGYYYILLAKTKNMVLDVKGGKGFSGCNVQLYSANGSDGQLWTLESTDEEGAVRIKSKTGFYLDVSGGNFENGTNIQVYDGNQSISQKFYLNKAYDPNDAITYARKYSEDTGKYTGVYNKNFTTDFVLNGGDCANFGSQCLFAGHFTLTPDWNPVYPGGDKNYSNGQLNWIRANGLKNYLESLGYPIRRIQSKDDLNLIHKGDIVFKINDKGEVSHTTICSDVSGTPKFCAHSAWRRDHEYLDVYDQFINGYIVDLTFSDSAKVSLPAPRNTGAAQQTVQTVQPTASNGQVCRTPEETMAWIRARVAEKWGEDVDGFAGCQCVDLIKFYIKYLTGGKTPNFIANAFEYAYFALPDGFTRITSNPQPGDIVVWDKNKGSAGSYGHVGIVMSVSGGTITVAETNYSGMMYVTVHDHPTSTVTCYIRPSFVSSNQPAVSTNLQPGRYKVITPVGVNVHAQASQNSTLIAAASPNVTFVVTEVKNGYGYTPEIYSWVGNSQSNHAGWVILDADCCEYLGEAVKTTEKPATTTKTTTTTTTTTTTSTTTAPPEPKLAGDINTDERVDVSDAVLMARFVAEDTVNISTAGRRNADADGDGMLNSDDVITILKMIAHLPVDTWKEDDGKTQTGTVKSEYWEYDIVSKKTADAPTMQGWKLVSTGWQQTGTGTYQYADFPSGFSQSDARYQAIGKSAGKNTESETAKRVYGNAAVKEYIYWHWCYPMAEKCSENDRYIGEYNGDQTPAGTCTVWEAFTSAENVNPSDKSGTACKITGHSDGYSYWWFRLPVYQQSYTDYQKQYTFEKTEHFKSEQAPAANQNAVNVRHYVLTAN
ncbi:MAG: RICIN domain-containing protein [Oscillospiraceae bacterium]|nr:RICIN domain-containing protein [Oscillospiraceae bacterium]